MKMLLLSQGKMAIVDNDDFEILNKWKWSFRLPGYAVRRTEGKIIRMHRFIMNPSKGLHVDHVNGDGLDNRKENLRICTNQENSWNKNYRTTNFSGVRGVYWNKRLNKWRSKIVVNGKHIHIGVFKEKNEAIKARQEAEIKYFGRFSSLNVASPLAGAMQQ